MIIYLVSNAEFYIKGKDSKSLFLCLKNVCLPPLENSWIHPWKEHNVYLILSFTPIYSMEKRNSLGIFRDKTFWEDTWSKNVIKNTIPNIH